MLFIAAVPLFASACCVLSFAYCVLPRCCLTLLCFSSLSTFSKENPMKLFSWVTRLGLFLTFTLPTLAQAPASSSAAPQADLLIRNGTVLTVTHGVIQNGSVLVHNGKIAQV